MILIVSFPDNAHVAKVVEHLRSPWTLVDTAWFPSSLGLDACIDSRGSSLRFTLTDGTEIDLDRVGAVWYRRISPIGLHEELTDPTGRLFAWSESNEALLGAWYTLPAFWMNAPLADEVAQRKIHQLRLARRLGLAIPDTLVTNRPEEARAFLAAHGPQRVIRKAFRNIREAPRETSVVREADLEVLDSVRYAPVIFQRFVPAALDLRVTIVDGDVFAASIRSQPEYGADYRLGLGSAEVRPYRLPDETTERLHALMRELGLSYGAIDLRVTPEGEHVFLEVNPAGEYLFISERTGQPIPAAIAAALERHAA